jgi:O-antigen ligase
MPPILALLLCIAFVLWLLRYDRRKAPAVSAALWAPTVWWFSVSTKPMGVWFADPGEAFASPLDQQFLLAMLGVGWVILLRRGVASRGLLGRQPWLMALLLYMGAGILWSDIPFTSFKRYIRELVAVTMALVVASERDVRQAIESMLRRGAYILVPFSVLLIKYFPGYGVEFGRWSGERMWVGVATQKNGLGRVCIVAALFLVWTLWRRRQGRDAPAGRFHTRAEWGLLLATLFLLLTPEGKNSATSIVALGLALLAFPLMGWRRRRDGFPGAGPLVAGAAVMIGCGTALALSGGAIGSRFNAVIGRDATFTGRADTWAELVPLAMQNPFLGCGFDGFWTPVTRELYRMSHAHSSYLELFLTLGACGLVLYTLFIAGLVRAIHATSAPDAGWGCLCLGYLFMALAHGAAESTIHSFAAQLGGLLLLMSAAGAALVARGDAGPPAGEPAGAAQGDARGNIPVSHSSGSVV